MPTQIHPVVLISFSAISNLRSLNASLVLGDFEAARTRSQLYVETGPIARFLARLDSLLQRVAGLAKLENLYLRWTAPPGFELSGHPFPPNARARHASHESCARRTPYLPSPFRDLRSMVNTSARYPRGT